MDTVQALRESWRVAASDLDIRVEEVGDAVLVADFGSEAGMLCSIRETRAAQEELRRDAEERGAGWSALGASYLTYDRDVFIEALNDWGWFGEGAPPDWYTGEPWTS